MTGLLLMALLARPTAVASWYDPKPAHVRMYGTQLLAAHRTIRPSTKVWVENVRTGRRVLVTVCGTGPFVRGRDWDLSRAAFRRIELPSRGLCRVRWRVR